MLDTAPARARVAPARPRGRVPARSPRPRPDVWSRPRLLHDRATLAVLLLICAGIALWWISTRSLPLRSMTDLGLVSVLPVGVWVSFLLVGGAFFVGLAARRTLAVVLAVVATVLVLHGLAVVGEPEMRFVVAWRHVGIADYFLDRGAIDPSLDAYQSWPGFFALSALLWDTAGLADLTSVARWAPVAYNLLYLPPVLVIARSLVPQRAVVWLSAWIFTVANWIGQDYFSPQGLSLFLYLVVVATVLRAFRGWEPPGRPAEKARQVVLILVVLLVAAALVASHQLTPFALVLMTAVLVLVGWCSVRTLPVIILLGALLWMCYAAVGYLSGNSTNLLQGLGAVTSVFTQNVGQRLDGSPGHGQVVMLRLLVTAGLWLAAAVGVLRLRRVSRPAAVRVAAVGLAPFPLLALQSYGGEALMRVALFALPVVAVLTAVALLGPAGDARRTGRRRRLAAAAIAGALLVATFPITRYGNEAMDWYSPQEVGAVRFLYGVAPPGAVLVAATDALPWKSTGYGDYEYRMLVSDERRVPAAGPAPAADESVDLDAGGALLREQVISRAGRDPGQPVYLVLTRSQGADLDLRGPWRPGALGRLETALRESGSFRPLLDTEDAVVLQLVEGGTS